MPFRNQPVLPPSRGSRDLTCPNCERTVRALVTDVTYEPSSRITLGGLLLATLGVLSILPIGGTEELGFVLIVVSALLLTAGLVWRFGLAAHVWAAVLGLLLLLMFGSYTVAGVTDGGEPIIIAGDATIAIGGALTACGAVSYLIRRRSPARRGNA